MAGGDLSERLFTPSNLRNIVTGFKDTNTNKEKQNESSIFRAADGSDFNSGVR